MQARSMVRAGAALAACALLAGGWLAVPVHAQTKVVIGTGKDPNLGAPIIIAQAKGFFKEAGLDADVKYFPSGGDLMTAVAGGSVPIGSSGATPVTTLRARPYPIRVIAQVADISGAQQMIVRQGFKGFAELQGKKIGIMRGTASEALFNAIQKHYGLDATKSEIVNMAPAEMLTAFVRNNVDAVVVWEPHTTRARRTGNGMMLVSGTKSNIPGASGDRRIYGDHALLFAHEDFLRDQAPVARSVISALAKAMDFIEKNRAEAIAIFAKEFGLEPAVMEEVAQANRYTLAINDELVNDLDALADALAGAKRIPAKVAARDWIDASHLRAVRPQLVTIR